MADSPENLVRLPSFLRRRFMRIRACDKNKESEELPQVLEKNLSAHRPIILARGARSKVLETFQIREIFPQECFVVGAL